MEDFFDFLGGAADVIGVLVDLGDVAASDSHSSDKDESDDSA